MSIQMTLLNGKAEIEKKNQLYYAVMKQRQHSRSRFLLDPLSAFILDSVTSVYKLEVLVMATTLLRYADCLQVDFQSFIHGRSQIILQNKTKKPIEIPGLFMTEHAHSNLSKEDLLLFTDSYEKVVYALNNAIPSWILDSLKTTRKKTHIFRFLRSTFLFLKHKPALEISKLLGHKSEEALDNYLNTSLINSYQSYLSKG